MPAWTVEHVWFLLFAAALVGAVQARANLGDSVGDAAGRYGAGTAIATVKPAETAESYARDNLRIAVAFWKSQSCNEQYRKADAGTFSGEETAALLKANEGNSSWQAISTTSWVRADSGAVAFVGDNQRALLIQSYAFHVELQRQKVQAGNFGASPPLFPKVARPPVTKIVYRTIAPNVPANSFADKRKTLYLAGDTYARVEEEPDPSRQVQKVVICNEPDVWLINLNGRQGKHLVDAGPEFIVRNTLFPRDAPGDFGTLELGKEAEYFRAHRVAPVIEQALDGEEYETLESTQANYRVVLKAEADTHKPLELDAFKDNRPAFSIIYISYEKGIPFSTALFTPPADVVIAEGEAGSH